MGVKQSQRILLSTCWYLVEAGGCPRPTIRLGYDTGLDIPRPSEHVFRPQWICRRTHVFFRGEYC